MPGLSLRDRTRAASAAARVVFRHRGTDGRYVQEPVGERGERIIKDLNEYRYWRDHRDHMIAEALDAGIPVYRIAMESGIHGSVIYKIRKRLAAFAES